MVMMDCSADFVVYSLTIKKMNGCFFFVFCSTLISVCKLSVMCAILLFCTAKSQEEKRVKI
jgi:hypothetical protein